MDTQRHDARIDDAERFVDDLITRAGAGGGAGLRRIEGPDSSGNVWAAVDALGRYVDAGLHLGQSIPGTSISGQFGTSRSIPGQWPSGRSIPDNKNVNTSIGMSPAEVATGLVEALECARMKASLAILVLRSPGIPAGAIGPIRDRLADAYQLIGGVAAAAERVVPGPRGLVRLHVRGARVTRAEVAAGLTERDVDGLVADARAALSEAARRRPAPLADFFWPAGPAI